jgi:hypothetical protein
VGLQNANEQGFNTSLLAQSGLVLDSDSAAKNQRGDKQDQEYEEQNLSDPSGCTSDTTEPQEGREECQNQEKNDPT